MPMKYIANSIQKEGYLLSALKIQSSSLQLPSPATSESTKASPQYYFCTKLCGSICTFSLSPLPFSSLGYRRKNTTVTLNIKTLSKQYNVHSCVNGYPSIPIKYSTALKMERIIIRALTVYSMSRLCFQRISVLNDSGVGPRRSRD